MATLRFHRSSSFLLASFFTVLVALTIGMVGYFIVLAHSEGTADNLDSLRDNITYMGIGIIAMMLAISAVGYFVGKYVVDLINTISFTASDIMHTGDLSRRIPLTTEWDDLSKLGVVLNEMLNRIEQLLNGIKQVSDNIAHDLRTPLTRLRNNLESLPEGEISEKLLREADMLLSMFNALLRISTLEAGKSSMEFQPVALHSLVHDVMELYEPIAEEKKLRLRAKLADCLIHGDRDLLFQAVVNLLDNAIKFTPEEGEVDFRLDTINNRALLTLSDTGEGIPEEEREAVFQRFYRTEASRTVSGHGLGLSMVKAVVHHHGGKIVLSGNNPGLIVHIAFPVNSTEA